MIGEIENAIIARIKSANDAGTLGYKLKKIDTWGGDNSEDLRKLIKDFPAVWVIYAGETPGRHTSKYQEQNAKFNIVIAAKSLRNEKEARHGSTGNVGSYQIIKDIKALINNNRLGLDINPLKPGRITSLLNEKSGQHLASIYGMEVSTIYREDQTGDVTSLDDFSTFHVNWDIPPHGNVGAGGLPDDANADATDNVTV